MMQEKQLSPENPPQSRGVIDPMYPYMQFAPMLKSGLEQIIEIQRTAFNIYEQNSRAMMESVRRVFPVTSSPIFEMAQMGMGQVIQIQKRSLDLVLNQSMAFIDAMGSGSVSGSAKQTNTLFRESVDYLFSMQKAAVDFITQQAQQFTNTAGVTAKPSSGTADALQRGTEAMVQAQKQFWELMLKPFVDLRSQG